MPKIRPQFVRVGDYELLHPNSPREQSFERKNVLFKVFFKAFLGDPPKTLPKKGAKMCSLLLLVSGIDLLGRALHSVAKAPAFLVPPKIYLNLYQLIFGKIECFIL